ncbi:glycosyltransferase involved in cell wall biosynthesis [Bradyrhizobium sp. USDA 4449]
MVDDGVALDVQANPQRNRPVRALIVTGAEPPMPGRDVHAVYRRLGMFVTAVAATCDDVEMLHFAQPGHWSFEKERNELNVMQSSYWGAKVSTIVAPANQFTPSWSGHAKSMLSVGYQGRFAGLAGRQQVEAVHSRLHQQPALVFAHRLSAMIPILKLDGNLPPVFFDLDDIEHWLTVRAALDKQSSLRAYRRLVQVPAIIAAERSAARLARRTFVCSELDAAYLRRLGYGNGVTCIPNAIGVPEHPQPVAKEPTILFLGGYHFAPNADAADRLISRIWPMILSEHPEARLIIAGNSPQSLKSFNAAPPGVEFPGIVADLEALYRHTRIVCCPITRGGGTRLKLVEAAAYGKPIVSTAIGAEGIFLEDGKDILIREQDEAIAEACSRLLVNDALCARLGEGAHAKAGRCYDLQQIRTQIIGQLLEGADLENEDEE